MIAAGMRESIWVGNSEEHPSLDSGSSGRPIARCDSLNKVRQVNYPSRGVNCSSDFGELCKRTQLNLCTSKQRFAALIPRTLRAKHYI